MSDLTEDTKTHAGKQDAVPGNDKAHAHSHAAHLQEQGPVATTFDAGKQGREAGTIQQPPQDPARSGKTHARQ